MSGMILNPIGVISGNPYSLSAYFQAVTTGRPVEISAVFLDSTFSLLSGGGSVLGTDTTSWPDEPLVLNTVAPGTAAYLVALFSVLESESGEQHRIGAIMIQPSTSSTRYFDANFSPVSDYVWEGTPNESVSDYYPELPVRLERLISALPDYIPIGSTFSLLIGVQAFAAVGQSG